MPVSIFENRDSRYDFEEWVKEKSSLKEKFIKEITENAIFQHIHAKEEAVGIPQCGTLQVAVAFAYYKKWLLIKNK